MGSKWHVTYIFPTPEDLKNSGLTFMSKLYEHAVAKQLNDHVEANALGNKHQSAYKTGHSLKLLCSLFRMTRILHCQKARQQQSFSSTYKQPSTPSTMTLSLIGYHHGLVYVGQLSYWSLSMHYDWSCSVKWTKAHIRCTTVFSSWIHTVLTLYHSNIRFHGWPTTNSS